MMRERDFDTFIARLYSAGWTNPNDAQWERITLLFNDLDTAILAERTRCAEVCVLMLKAPITDNVDYEAGWKAALDLAKHRIKEG